MSGALNGETILNVEPGLHVPANNRSARAEGRPLSNLDATMAFLHVLDASGTFTFQTFDDDKVRKDLTLAKWLHGDLFEHADRLRAFNEKGAGIFVMVNAGDGKGRSNKNVQTVRALFIDIDSEGRATLERVLAECTALEVPPHIVVESSEGKYHVYWLVTGCSRDQHKPAQKALIRKYGTDPQVTELARVMRLPGFVHLKDKPCLTRSLELRERPPYEFQKLCAELNLEIGDRFQQSRPNGAANTNTAESIVEGERNGSLFRLGARARGIGFTEEAIRVALQAQNEERAHPPLATAEVDRIASNVVRYVPQSFLLEGAARVATPNFVRADALISDIRPTPFLIDGYLAENTLAGLIGQSGSGKTFVVLDWGLCIASGTPWFGKIVQQRAVFYLAGEGRQGLSKRILGWSISRGVSLEGIPLFVSSNVPALALPDLSAVMELEVEIERLARESGHAPGVIIVDTLARAMAGANENSAEDMGRLVATMDGWRHRFGATVITVHHTGHAEKNRARGSSAYYAALDTEFQVEDQGGHVITLNATKAKDWDCPSPLQLKLVKQVVPARGDTESQTTLVPSDPSVPSQDLVSEARKLKREGLTCRAIEQKLGMSKSWVSDQTKGMTSPQEDFGDTVQPIPS